MSMGMQHGRLQMQSSCLALAGPRDSYQIDQDTELMSCTAAMAFRRISWIGDNLACSSPSSACSKKAPPHNPTKPALVTNHVELLTDCRIKPNHLHKTQRAHHSPTPAGLSSLIAGHFLPDTINSGTPTLQFPENFPYLCASPHAAILTESLSFNYSPCYTLKRPDITCYRKPSKEMPLPLPSPHLRQPVLEQPTLHAYLYKTFSLDLEIFEDRDHASLKVIFSVSSPVF